MEIRKSKPNNTLSSLKSFAEWARIIFCIGFTFIIQFVFEKLYHTLHWMASVSFFWIGLITELVVKSPYRQWVFSLNSFEFCKLSASKHICCFFLLTICFCVAVFLSRCRSVLVAYVCDIRDIWYANIHIEVSAMNHLVFNKYCSYSYSTNTLA